MDAEFIQSPEIRFFVDGMLSDFEVMDVTLMINYTLSDVPQKVILLPEIT